MAKDNVHNLRGDGNGDGDDAGDVDGPKSVEELEAARARVAAEAEAEGDGQFVLPDTGRRVTLGTVIPRGTPTEHAFKFGSARRQGAGTLMQIGDEVLIVMRGKVRSVTPVGTLDDEENLKRVVVETLIAPKSVVPADSEEGMSLLADVLAKHGRGKAA